MKKFLFTTVRGVFNAEQRRFDHHQKSFTDTFHSLQPDKHWTIKLSSAGLIYVHYGREILKELLKKEKTIDENVKNHLVEILFNKLYDKFVQKIDAIDIGENMKYKITTNLSARCRLFQFNLE